MAQPKGYLARSVTFNNPAYKVWDEYPVGVITFECFTEVRILKPSSREIKRLRMLANERKMDAFVVKLEGQRVFLTRDALLTPEEYNEARGSETARSNDQKDRQRAKLALLKDRSRNVG
jgi:hypothetical protein